MNTNPNRHLLDAVCRLIDEADGIHPDDPSKITITGPTGMRVTHHVVGFDLRRLR
jgi:hypothetical protein